MIGKKLGLSWAKLGSSLPSYARWANCFYLDCQFSHIGHLNLVIVIVIVGSDVETLSNGDFPELNLLKKRKRRLLPQL